MVWAAGIKAPDFMKEIGPRDQPINQLVVHETQQTTRDENIFVIGDCAACPQPDGVRAAAPSPPTRWRPRRSRTSAKMNGGEMKPTATTITAPGLLEPLLPPWAA